MHGSNRFVTLRFLLLLFGALLLMPQDGFVARADEGALSPTGRDSNISRYVSLLMAKRHISQQRLNDELSKRALELYIKSLDPLKLYFLQSDVDAFQAYQTQLDDRVPRGDLRIGFDVFKRFLARVDQRIAMADALLNEPFDFDAKETIVVDADERQYPKSDAEARDRMRRQLKYSLLVLKNDGEEEAEAIEKLRRRYARIGRRYKKFDNDMVLEIYLTAVTTAYDPHSTYMSPDSLTDFRISLSLNLDGIGAALQEKDGQTIVTNVIPGGAADRHGKLKADDEVVFVGQGDDLQGATVDVVEMPLRDVVKLIRGKAGTKVRLGVKPGGVGNVETYVIERDRIELDESAARGQIIEQPLPGGTSQKIGYINLPSFYLDMEAYRRRDPNFRSSTRDVRKILDDFRAKGVDGVVLDLSQNGGGSLPEAVDLTGLFIDKGPVVQVKDSFGSVENLPDETAGVSWSGPLVVVTSQFSASASEILAGAIQDYGRGLVVGDPTTHGKGTVQTLMDLGFDLFGDTGNRENLGALKLTIQQFYLPDGESTQLEGVKADVVLPSVTQHFDVSEGDLDYALANDKVPRLNHQQYGMVQPKILADLRSRSMARIAEDEEFGDLLRRVDNYVKQKEEKTISLNEADFLKRRAELDAQKEEEEKELEMQKASKEVYRDYFYNREIMNITSDYIEMLRRQNLAKR